MMSLSRDIYRSDIDFTALALQYPSFAKKLKANRQLDFSDPESVRQLTVSLLHRDFNISLSLPDDRLCPPVPNRLNYIFWLQDLLDCTSYDYRDSYDPNRQVIGLDIGTGASCIYPLLGCRQRTQWRFIATETDHKSSEFASLNIRNNNLTPHIRLLPTNASDVKLVPTEQLKNIESIDFVMTNPPFYESQAEMLESAKKKQRPPNSACTGAPVEMITQGGEVQFVSQIVKESMLPYNKAKIQWFSSMLGKLSSVSTIVERLNSSGCYNYAVTEFIQGQKTRRWAVAWSWQDLRPTTKVARGIPGFEKRLLPFPSEFEVEISDTTLPEAVQTAETGAKLDKCISELDLQWQWKSGIGMGMGLSKGDVWSRKARRRKKREDQDEEMKDTAEQPKREEDVEPALVFKVRLSAVDGKNAVLVKVQWVQGSDSILFESFCGWLKRRLESC